MWRDKTLLCFGFFKVPVILVGCNEVISRDNDLMRNGLLDLYQIAKFYNDSLQLCYETFVKFFIKIM